MKRLPAARLALMAWLVLLWQVLWRDVSAANLAGGVALAALVTAIRPRDRTSAEGHTVRPLRLLAFLGYFAWQLVMSNLVVAREIVTRRDHIRSGIVAVPLGDRSDLATTVLADAITLTPGTLSVEVRRSPPTLYVHVLHVRDVEAVRRQILRLQRMVLLAIGPADAVGPSDAGVPRVPVAEAGGGTS